jgi:hypothetical protein
MAGKYTQELATELVAAYADLGAVSFACDAVGISKVTFYDWMHRGERGEEPYQELFFAFRRQRAQLAKELIQEARVDKGGAAFLLTQLFPAEFGQSGKAGRDAMQTILDTVWPHLSDSARQEFLSAISAVERQRAGAGESAVAEPEEARAGAIDVEGECIERQPRRLESGPE